MKIYTKTGDTGETSLVGGSRVSKSHVRIETYGTVDELNSWIGLLAEYTINDLRKPFLREIQDRLFTIGSQLATESGKHTSKLPELYEADVSAVELQIDQMNEALLPLQNFILPGGHKEVAFCHIARTVCRRAERLVVTLNQKEHVEALVIVYFNRLSDYLFVLSRAMSKDLAVDEVIWKPRKGLI